MKKKIISFMLALLICMGTVSPAAFADSKAKNEIHITSADELRKLSEDCILDEYSVGLSVILDCDIDLDNQPFRPIPTFSGVFDGGGHTISNFVSATDGSHQGFFRYLQKGGEIKSLTVTGKLDPGGSRCQVGGIVGTNYGNINSCAFSGTVSGMNYVGGIVGENFGTVGRCVVSGSVSGKRFTGGIAGWSNGTVFSCSNSADVNIGISSGGLEMDDINLSSLTGLNLTSAEDTNIVSDTGGIAGFSSGSVSECKNFGTVGYPHYGYNVGGIIGRQSGYVNGCENHGNIYGRKDVAGIVGQMEPYLLLKDTASLAREIQILQYMINAAMANSSELSSDMAYALRDIGYGIEDWYEELYGQGGIPPIDIPTKPGDDDPTMPDTPDTPDIPDTPSVPDTPDSGDDGDEDGEYDAQPLSRFSGSVSALHLGKILHTRPRLEPIDIGGITVDTGSLKENTEKLDAELDNFTDLMSWSAQVIASDIGGIGNQLAKVMLMMANIISGAAKPVIYEDVSDKEPGNSVQGRVNGCTNYGRIEGDSNVGGIAGDMGIEYEFDLENELVKKVGNSNLISQTFLTKCISSSNINRGTVSAKKDNVGGIAGQSQVGTVNNCVNYGDINSTEGRYVGGIVGYSLTSVSGCSSMCELDGVEYVGGIVGSGKKISDCLSLVSLNDVTACAGAIAGYAEIAGNDGIKGNMYVNSGTGAIDGISYAKLAYPIEYEEMLKLKNLPEDFGKLKLSFVADGELVGEVFFEYGGTIDEADIPPVPEKDGFNGAWAEHDYSSLRFSDTIEAVYTPRQAALASVNTREDSPLSIALIEGDFAGSTKLHLAPYQGEAPVVEASILHEMWVLSIDGAESSDSYNVRYLEPEHTLKAGVTDIYILRNGSWEKTDVSRSGSYLIFRADGERVVFCSVEHESPAAVEYFIIAAAAAAVLIAVGVTVKIRKKKKVSTEQT